MEKSLKVKKHRNVIFGTCMVILTIILMVILLSNNTKDKVTFEVFYELNNKLYSVIYNAENESVFEEYNLEKNITTDLLGEYIGDETIRLDYDGNVETFQIYKYANAPITEYDWTPRLILKAANGEYYHALIGSYYGDEINSVDEVKSVYGILSPKDIISITNNKGDKFVDRDFINEFYSGLFTNEFGENEFLQENVFKNTGIDESEIDQLYSKYADDMNFLFVELSNGLVLDVKFTSHNYVEVFHGLYFKVDDNWLTLVSKLK